METNHGKKHPDYKCLRVPFSIEIMQATLKLLRFFLAALILISCSHKQEISIDDHTYYPTDSGSVADFDVTKTVYTVAQKPQTTTYKLRQTITGSYKNIDGTPVYKLLYTSTEKNNAWHQDSSTILWRTIDKVIMHETGMPVVKLLFPLFNGATWNANLYNAQSETMVSVHAKGKPYVIGNTTYPNTITIIRQDDSTSLSRNRHIEIYAAEIGLVLKEKVFLRYCQNPDCLGKGQIISGYHEKLVLKTYSK